MAVETRRVADLLRRSGCTAIVAGTEHVLDLPLAYTAARRARVGFYAHLFDYYSEKWTGPVSRLLARGLEGPLLRRADGVVVPNPLLAEALERRYGVRPAVVPNAVDVSGYESRRRAPDPVGDEAAVVYTGAVYEAHYDAFRNLLSALDSLTRRRARLHVYSGRSADELAARGLAGPLVAHPPQPADAMPAVQASADVLFLPLAFASPYPEVIRTSAPCKMAEYLAAGRPILVHAPADSFVARYFREHDCGLVVDRPEQDALAAALEQLLEDDDVRTRLAANAAARAAADFDLERARAAFADAVPVEAHAR
jgi:glycosyltransferase involved in cell wall biosynthesis